MSIGSIQIERGSTVLQSSKSAIKRYEHNNDKVFRCYASWVFRLGCSWLVNRRLLEELDLFVEF